MTDYLGEILRAIGPIHAKARSTNEQIIFWKATKEMLEYVDEILEISMEEKRYEKRVDRKN